MRRTAAWIAGLLLVAGSVAGCASSTSSAARAGTCLAPLTVSGPASPGSEVATYASYSSTTSKLPGTSFACLDGTGNVKLASVGRPMIVSMWATWCGPCRAEVPHIESFAEAAGNAVAVVGIDSSDSRSAATSFVSDFKLTYPMVSDPAGMMQKAIPPHALPTLLFVSADGHIVHSLATNQLDDATLRQLTATYLGVTVA
jgi:thiol-disulfide isomerase/thioredoxin